MTSLLDQIRDDHEAGSSLSIHMESSDVISIADTNKRFEPIYNAIDQIQSECDFIDHLYRIKRTGLPAVHAALQDVRR